MVPVLYYFQFNLLTYQHSVDTPDTPSVPQPTVIEGNQGQPEDKPPSGATLYNFVQMHLDFLLLLLHYCYVNTIVPILHCSTIWRETLVGETLANLANRP